MDQQDTHMRAYYKERAPVYDRIYAYPERQADFRRLEKYIAEQFVGLDVLEVAAGTGYWTQFIAAQALSVLATDASAETLELINQRKLTSAVPIKVPIKVADAYALNQLNQQFQGAFAGLWFSHVPKQRVNEFLQSLHQCLTPGATVLFMDNTPAQCDRLPLSHTDEVGNTYQQRALDDGTVHSVVKNFPTEQQLMAATADFGTAHQYIELEHFWLFQYKSN